MRAWPFVAIPLAWVLQVLLAGRFGPLNAVPDLPLLLAAFAGLLMGPETGAATGFFVGLLQDLSFSRYVGLHALSKAAGGLAAGYLGKRVIPDALVVPFLVGFGVTFVDDLAALIILKTAGAGAFVLHRQMLVVTAGVYNAVLGPLAFMFLSRLCSRKPAVQGKV
ncbi:MAG: rod shape-determining protein MreD [Ignavibacteriales bacterium]